MSYDVYELLRVVGEALDVRRKLSLKRLDKPQPFDSEGGFREIYNHERAYWVADSYWLDRLDSMAWSNARSACYLVGADLDAVVAIQKSLDRYRRRHHARPFLCCRQYKSFRKAVASAESALPF